MATMFPIDVTVEGLIAFLAGPGIGMIRTIGEDEIGRDLYADPSPTVDDTAGVVMLHMALNGASSQELRAWLHDTEEAVQWRARQARSATVTP